MRLLTHNMLVCNKRQCEGKNFPLKVRVEESAEDEEECNQEFLQHLFPKLDWPVFVATAKEAGLDVPLEITKEVLQNEEACQKIHHALMAWKVVQGALICQNCEREYPIADTIPNMILNEDELQ